MIFHRLVPRSSQCLWQTTLPIRPAPAAARMRLQVPVPAPRRLLSTEDISLSTSSSSSPDVSDLPPPHMPDSQLPLSPSPVSESIAATPTNHPHVPSSSGASDFWQHQLQVTGHNSTTTAATTSNGSYNNSNASSSGSSRPSAAAPRLPTTQARVVPLSPSYFSRSPFFNDHLVHIDALLTKYDHLPLVPAEKSPKVAWKGRESFAEVGEHIKALQYAIAMRIAKRLNMIHPSIMPEEVKEALVPFKRDVDPNISRVRVIPVDTLGRALGVGRRKRAVARAWVIEGTGEIIVNGRPLSEAFARVHDRESAIWALRVTNRMDKYNAYVLVDGGGTTGQAEAVAMAVAMGMMGHEPDLKPALRRAGCVTRDPREVERKKAGRLKARKKPAWNAR